MSKPTHRFAFDRFDDYVAEVSTIAPSKARESHATGQHSFYWTETWDEAAGLAKNGWAEGASRVAEIRASLDHLVAAANQSVQEFAWDITGDFYDIGRVLSGESECAGSYVTNDQGGRSGSARVVRLYANLGVSGCVSAEALFARGACVLAAVDVIEALGVRVELWACKNSNTDGKSNWHQVEVLVKAANQPADVDRLAFAISHPSFLRRFLWAHSESRGFKPGCTQSVELELEEGCVKTSPAFRNSSHTREELVEEVIKICSQCGITIPNPEELSLETQ
jgi:hypothetical protein